jgi:hypothetical protein
VVIARAIRRQGDAFSDWQSRRCDVRGNCEVRHKLFYAAIEELSGLGVLPSLAVLMLLVVPYSLQTNIVQPCLECYDFEVSELVGKQLRPTTNYTNDY